jgi:heme A synthase
MKQNRRQALVQAGSPRQEQMRRFRRYQLFGVLLVAAAILLAALLRTNPQWIFPQGWWRP